MAKLGGKLLIKYRDPVAASFSSKDIVLNVQTGTLFYKRNRQLFALRGTPDNFDLVVFPGQSTNQQILINDSSQEDGSPIMEGTDQFRFKLASATCGCANYFYIGTETLTHFSGSVRIGEHLPSTCNLLNGEVDPSLLVHGNMVVSASAGGIGNITATGNISASLNLYGTNTYIENSLIHVDNNDTKLTFGTDTISLYSAGVNIATVSSASFKVNGLNNLFIPGTDSSPSSGTSVLVLDNTTGQVYKTGSYGLTVGTFKGTGVRTGNGLIDGNLTVTGNISASGKLYGGLLSSSKPNVVFYNNTTGELTYATSESLSTGGTDITVSDEGNSLTTAATSFNFVGNAVSASSTTNNVTVNINAITKSLWYDGQSTDYISSSNKVFIDKTLALGTAWKGQVTNVQHDIHISASTGTIDDKVDIGFEGPLSYGGLKSKFSIGLIDAGSTGFFIKDHSGASGSSDGNNVIFIHMSSSVNNTLRPAQPSLMIMNSKIQDGDSGVSPNFNGAVGTEKTDGVTILVDPASGTPTGSAAKFHINTRNENFNKKFNGLLVGPEFNTPGLNQISGSGLYIHMGSEYDGGSASPKILGRNEKGLLSVATAATERPLIIEGEINIPGVMQNTTGQGGVARYSGIAFHIKDEEGFSYSQSLAGIGPISGGQANSSTMGHIFGTGTKWIQGLPGSDSNMLYTFYNDKKTLFAIEASGRVGIGDFDNENAPLTTLDIRSKSGSHAAISLTPVGSNLEHERPYIEYTEPGGAKSEIGLFGVPSKTAEILYNNQRSSSLYLESKGITVGNNNNQYGVQNSPYPFNILGGATGSFTGANSIQFVVGGDDKSYLNDLTSSNGTSAITVKGISDFKRIGEVGIGLIDPSSSLHVTKSVQADNFRTTNPVDILIDNSNHTIEIVSASNQIVGTNTVFTEDFKTGDAVKITGKSTISTITGAYTGSNNSQTASIMSTSGIIVGNQVYANHPEFVRGDTLLISSGSNPNSGSYHLVTGIVRNVGVGHDEIYFTPAYTGVAFSQENVLHRVNTDYYQITTVTSIHSNTSMSIEDNWSGHNTNTSVNKGFKENILFQVKTADYNPRFTVNAHGDITASGTASFGFLDIDSSNLPTFKSTGQRNGDSAITGSLTVTGTIKAQEFHTEFITSSVIFESGSTQFGDTADDTHTFIGNITASGNIAVGTGPGSVAISASGHVFAGLKQSSNTSLVFYNTSSGELTHATTSSLLGGLISSSTQIATEISGAINSATSSILINYGLLSSSAQIATNISGAINSATSSILVNYGLLSSSAQIATNISGAINSATSSILTNYGLLSGSAQIATNISGAINSATASLSASIASNAANTFKSTGQRNGDSAITGSLEVTNHITASGNISASGLLFASSSVGNYSDVVVQDITTGRFYTTSSAALSATLPGGILSSSTQIATEISGAINSATSSILTNYGLLSGSAQIATNISGAINSATSSILTNYGLLSGSAQIATNISGAINSATSSILTNYGLLSGSAQIATNISGAINSATSSILTNYGLLSGSAQIATNISGAINSATSSLSASLATSIANITTNTFKTTGQRSGDSAITGSLEVIGGNLTLGENGDGHVFKAHGNSNGVNISFNDNSSDMLKLTDNTKLGIGIHGSTSTADLEISHNGTDTIIENKTGNLLISASTNQRIEFRGNITASGDISASGLLYTSSSLGLQNIATYNSESGQYFYTSSAGLSAQLDTFKSTGVRTGNSTLSGSLIIRSTGATNPGDANLTIVGGGSSADDATLALRQNLTAAGYALKYDGGLDHFQILGNNESDVHLSIQHGDGRVRIPGTISSSGQVFHGGLTYGTADSLVTVVAATGEFKRQGIAGALASASIGLLSSSAQIATNISGAINSATASLSASLATSIASNAADTFKSTGKRNGNSEITGSLTVTGTITAQEFHTEFVSSSVIFSSGSTQFGDTLDDTHTFVGNITASNNISASGLLFASSSQGNFSDVVVQDLTTGRFYTTSSAALSTTLPGGILSSSTQIATNISGAINSATSSILTNYGLLSGSAQIATNISGAINSATSSILTNYGLLSGSAQIATNISGAINSATASLSASLATSIASNASNTFKSTGQRSGNSGITGSLHLTGSTSNLTIDGTSHFKDNVGIGVTPNTNDNIPLHIKSINVAAPSQTPTLLIESDSTASAAFIQFKNVDANYLLGNIGDGGNDGFFLKTVTPNKFPFFVSKDASSFMLSVNQNKVGIGYATPSHTLHVSGNIVADGLNGSISASGTLKAGLSNTDNANLVFYNPVGGELTYAASSSFLLGLISSSAQIATDISGAIDAATGSLLSSYTFLSSSNQIADDISGSWQGQNFITASQTFLSTGQRNGNSAITGSFEVTADITGSNLLIQRSNGQGNPPVDPTTSSVAIFQHNDNSKDASIAIIAADTRGSQLHFGRHDDIDIGSIKYFHDGHSSPDQFKFKVNGTNVVTFNNIANRGRIGVGLDFTPTDYFHAQGPLSGGGLTISSSNGGTILLKSGNTKAT